jgi:tRNA(adenine34) deaminase
VLSMDTTFPDNTLRYRAITNPSLWRAAYATIIAAEGLTCLLLTAGAIALVARLGDTADAFNRAKVWAVAGLTVGFGVWFFGFLVVAGEYLAMWQSRSWNGQEAAFRFTMVILGVLIFLVLPDRDKWRPPRGLRENSHMHCCDDCSASRVSPLLPSRRTMIVGLTSTAVLSASRASAAAGASADDERFMRLALDEARRGDYPFGAVIVRDGEVIAHGRNLGRTDGDPTAHGEMVAIRRCLADRGRAALQGSTLYTSGEPCAMCMGAIIWCHMGRLVFAASVEQLATKIDQIMIPSAEVAAKAPFAPITITGGVLADEAMQLFAK